jgi:hypothetical protein
MRNQSPWTYLPCLSRSVPGCVAVLVNIGRRQVEWVRFKIPLKVTGPGPRTLLYQLGRHHKGAMGECRRPAFV